MKRKTKQNEEEEEEEEQLEGEQEKEDRAEEEEEKEEKQEKLYLKAPGEGPGPFIKSRLEQPLQGEALKIALAIQTKENWHQKLLDLDIAQKYRKEAISQGASNAEVDAAFSHLLGLVVSGSVRNLLTFPQEDDHDWNEDDEDYQGGEDEDVGDSCDPRIRYIDKVVPDHLRTDLETELDKIANAPQKDYHPNTKEMVQDLIHPSLFPYIRGVSLGHDGQPYYSEEYLRKQQPPPPTAPQKQVKDKEKEDQKKETQQEEDKDPLEDDEDPDGDRFLSDDDEWESRGLDGQQERFYKKQLEEIEGIDSIYQWLPTEFHVDSAGLVTVQSYINNLPTQEPHNSKLLEKTVCSVFRLFVPLFEDVLGVSLLSRNLQVIVKAANYVLRPGDQYEGAWHIEGMKHEHIVASGVYYYSMINMMEGNSLAFRELRPNSLPDRERAHNWNFYKNIGRVNTIPDRCLVFTNTLQHKVKHLSNSFKEPATRKILCFFLVDPEHRIVSSANIHCQNWDQNKVILTALINQATTQHIGKQFPPDVVERVMSFSKWGFTLEEAKEHRLKLMEERKFFQDRNNRLWERMYSFCEH